MPYTFKSKAHSDILMLNDSAQQILGILGKKDLKKGIIEPQDIPATIQALEQAIAREKQAVANQNVKHKPLDQNRLEPSQEDLPVLLEQRAWPFLEMLKASYTAHTPVVWGV